MLHTYAGRDGGLVRLDPDTGLAGAIWIDLLSPTPAEVALVTAATGLALPDQAAIHEIETSSRLSTRDGALYLNLPMITVDDGPRVVSVGFVLTEARLITVRFAPSVSFDAFPAHPLGLPSQGPQHGTHQGAASGRVTAAHVFGGLMETIIDRQADHLEGLSLELERISHHVFRPGTREGRRDEDHRLRETLRRLGTIGDLLSHIRDSQVVAARIIPYVEQGAADWLPRDMRSRLRTLRQDIDSVADFTRHLGDKLQFMLDATLGFINIAQNNLMKVMTVASVAGIPPVLVAAVYGMNFKVMPELDWEYGYLWGIGAIIVSTLIPLGLFRWRRWI
jgi:magnesium transporter